ncbi:vicilin-like seed storage protein At2g18540 isoform X2 [Durio zibethinus]|uniref:Vicilin-like seed storage protein At2g18540 isoform X2 n=1 Tax=Durio zibethinus TaxID=66656 RepID=A0A6P6BEC4_DURZI|nr:vicilin-like seed storage protein At2g18540 isoform X2 [Durio zibethinus]
MSRCYPYPPPGYVKNGIRDEALIKSIKREEEKAKKERKKEKREKKEKKREKKERDKARGSGEFESKKYGHNKRHKDERSQEDKIGGDHQKRRENEVEIFEKSTLTEEHGHAVGPQNSSDSTLNSNKRQKLSSPPDSGHNPGSIIRIRLPSQRHKDPEVLPSKEQPCSTSGRIDDAFVQGMHEHAPRPGRELEEHPCSTSSIRWPEVTFKLSKEKPCPSSGASESVNAEASLSSNLCSTCSPILALEFKNLVEDWVVPTLQMQSELTSFNHEDWLFQKKLNHKSWVEGSKDGNVGSSQINSKTWPHARYLPEADIYALPFTVPF